MLFYGADTTSCAQVTVKIDHFRPNHFFTLADPGVCRVGDHYRPSPYGVKRYGASKLRLAALAVVTFIFNLTLTQLFIASSLTTLIMIRKASAMEQ